MTMAAATDTLPSASKLGGPSAPADACDDGPEAQPSECREGQRIHQPVRMWMKDPPQGKHERTAAAAGRRAPP